MLTKNIILYSKTGKIACKFFRTPRSVKFKHPQIVENNKSNEICTWRTGWEKSFLLKIIQSKINLGSNKDLTELKFNPINLK